MREQPLQIDPIVGLEEARCGVLRVSKSAFYGPNGIRSRLPVIQLSARRKGVRKSALDAFLVERTCEPAEAGK
jgi:hypothetical protein